MPPWCIGIHGSNAYKLNTLAMPFYSVFPLTRIPSALLVAKLLKMEQETVLEPDGAAGSGCGASGAALREVVECSLIRQVRAIRRRPGPYSELGGRLAAQRL
jgi:hypothetical protein